MIIHYFKLVIYHLATILFFVPMPGFSQSPSMNDFKDHKLIIVNSRSSIEPDQQNIDWGRNVLADIGIKGLKTEERAERIRLYITSHFKYSPERPKNITDFLESKTGNCRAHSIMSIFLLRLSGIPAKFAYEVHLELKSPQSSETARARGTGLFGHYHNDHMWVLYYNGNEWIPFDSALGYSGYCGFKSRWQGSENIPANPPFVVWEDTGNGISGMTNITQSLWGKNKPETGHNAASVKEWSSFVSFFYDKDVSFFQAPLDTEVENMIAELAKSYFGE